MVAELRQNALRIYELSLCFAAIHWNIFGGWWNVLPSAWYSYRSTHFDAAS